MSRRSQRIARLASLQDPQDRLVLPVPTTPSKTLGVRPVFENMALWRVEGTITSIEMDGSEGILCDVLTSGAAELPDLPSILDSANKACMKFTIIDSIELVGEASYSDAMGPFVGDQTGKGLPVSASKVIALLIDRVNLLENAAHDSRKDVARLRGLVDQLYLKFGQGVVPNSNPQPIEKV